MGDVYYSATPDEAEQRFFRFWPNKAPVNRTYSSALFCILCWQAGAP
jgi:hypothetical protein